MRRNFWGALGYLAGVLTSPALAQVSGATLTGTIMDASGAVVPNVKVSIRNEATGELRVVAVDASGFYTAPNLLPATYDVSASAPGFATSEQKGIKLTVGAQQLLNFKMQIGQVTEKVEVTDQAPSV